MKTPLRCLIFLNLVFSCAILNAQYSLDWDKFMNDGYTKDFTNIYKEPNNSYSFSFVSVFGSTTPSFCHGNWDILDYSLDTFGTAGFIGCFGGSDQEVWPKSKSNNGKKYFISSSSSIDGDLSGIIHKGDIDIWLRITDGNGLQIVNKTIGGSSAEFMSDFIINESGELLIASYTMSSDGDFSSGNKGFTDIGLTKIDSVGNIIWSKTYGSSDYDFGTKIIEVSGGYLVLGNSRGNDGDVSNTGFQQAGAWMLFIDNHGNKIWDKSFGNIGCNSFSSGLRVGDNKILIAGGGYASEQDSLVGNLDVFLLHFDLSYQLQKTEIWSGSNDDYISDILLDEFSGRLFYLGTTESTDGDFPINKGMSDCWLAMTDQLGNVLFRQTFGGSLDDRGKELFMPYPDIIWVSSYGLSSDGDALGNQNQNNWNVWIRQLKLDPNWVSREVTKGFTFSLFPNPSNNGYFQLQSGNKPFPENMVLTLTDINGRIIPITYSTNNFMTNLDLQIQNAQSGIYFLHISGGDWKYSLPLQVLGF